MSHHLLDIIKILCVFLVQMCIVAYLVLVERRVAAWIQDRVGPNRVGFQGLLQPIADFGKLIFKEDVIPSFARRTYFFLAPALVVMPSLIVMGVIPFGSNLGGVKCVIADVDIGLLVVFAITSMAVYGIALAGWSSNSKYSIIGGIRSSAQYISYEVCLGLSTVGIIMMVGSLNLGKIVEYQGQHGWMIFWQPLAFVVFLCSSFAETNRAPFDFPEAEQELVGGYHTEYSGMKFALFFMGEYSNVVFSSALMVTLFLGGWSLPFAPFNAPATGLGVGIAHILIFLAKVFCVLFFFIWVRWTVPRFRYDQLMRLGWNVMLPLALVNLVLTGVVIWWRNAP